MLLYLPAGKKAEKIYEKPNLGSYTLYILYVFSVRSRGQPFAQMSWAECSVCLSFQWKNFFILMPFFLVLPSNL